MGNLDLSDESLANWMTKIRHDLHRHPELADHEFDTTRTIKRILTDNNIKVLDYAGKTGVLAEIGTGSGPYVALRADIDALPLDETSGVDYTSETAGVMHACGHDFHTASLLGAALLLKDQEASFNGTIRLLFEPGEERHTGAKEMIKNGALENISAIAGFHNMPNLPVGTLGLKSGKLMASNDNFDVEIKGVGSHAAIPEKSTDPIVTLAQLITALQTIRSRNISPSDSLVLTVGAVSAGHTYNVIPDSASFKGTIRAYSSDDRDLAKKRFYELVDQITQAYNQKAVIGWDKGPGSVDNDEQVTELLKQALQDTVKIVPATMSNADDDFAEYEEVVPGFYGFLGSNGPADLHHSDFVCDDRGLIYGAKFHLTAATAMLQAVNDGKLARRDQ